MWTHCCVLLVCMLRMVAGQTPSRTPSRTRTASATVSASATPPSFGLGLVESNGSLPLLSVTLSIDTLLWDSSDRFPAGQCLWRQDRLPSDSRESQALSAGFSFGIVTTDLDGNVAVPCNISTSAFLDSDSSASAPPSCRTKALYRCILPPYIDSLTWAAYGQLDDLETGEQLRKAQDGLSLLQLPQPAVLSALHTGYVTGRNSRDAETAGLAVLAVNLTRARYRLTLGLLSLITLDGNRCRVDDLTDGTSTSPADASDTNPILTLPLVCDTPASLWRGTPAQLLFLDIGPSGNALAAAVLPNTRAQRPFLVDPPESWFLGITIRVSASGIADVAPFALQLLVANGNSTASGNSNSSGGRRPGPCPPAVTETAGGAVSVVPSSCTVVPCINVTLPDDATADDARDFVACYFGVITDHFADAHIAAVQLYYSRTDSGGDGDGSDPQQIPTSAANVTSTVLAFDGSMAANLGAVPFVPRPQLVSPRYVNVFDQPLDWLPRQVGGIVRAALASRLWSSEDIAASTGSAVLQRELPQLAFRSPSPPRSVRVWLVDHNGHIPCPVLRAGPDSNDPSATLVFAAVPAGDQPGMRLVLEVAGIINITADGLPGDAALPLPFAGPPSDPRWRVTEAGASDFALRYPPFLGAEDKQYLYEPSPDAPASSAARLVNVRARGDWQFLQDFAAGRVNACLIAGRTYPAVLPELDYQCYDDCPVICKGVNESAVAEAVIPRAMELQQSIVGVHFGIWWAGVTQVWSPDSDRDGGLRFVRRAKLRFTVPYELAPGDSATLVGDNLCIDPMCAIPLTLPPSLSVSIGGVPVQDLQFVSTSVLRFTAPLVPRSTPGWPLVNVTFRDAHGYASFNEISVSYPATDGVVIEPAAPLPPYFVPSDADAVIALPSLITVRAVLDGIPLGGEKAMNCTLSSRSSRASLRNSDVDGADITARSGPDGIAYFPSVAVLASF